MELDGFVEPQSVVLYGMYSGAAASMLSHQQSRLVSIAWHDISNKSPSGQRSFEAASPTTSRPFLSDRREKVREGESGKFITIKRATTMTRTPFAHHPLDGDDSDILAAVNLARLLARLEHNLLSPSADLKPLRRSQYHRARVATVCLTLLVDFLISCSYYEYVVYNYTITDLRFAWQNLEYARSLLLQLEKSLPKIKRPDKRHERQTDLARKRQTLKLLKDRLEGINADAEVHATTTPEIEGEVFTSDEEDEVEGEEDLLATPEEKESPTTSEIEIEEERPNIPPPTTTTDMMTTTTETPSPTLRHRPRPSTSHPSHPHAPPAEPTATATGTSYTNTQTQRTEQTLTTHLHEQESLTTSLLSLASQLKSSSQSLQRSLEAEKPLLARAVEGLDRNVTGLEAAGQRMGMLRRMTEGRGWWGRVMMYMWIFVLWFVAVGIVFLGPKLRF